MRKLFALVFLILFATTCVWAGFAEVLHVGHCWHGTYQCGAKRCCNDCGLPCN